jgi:hypothetical protein
LNLPRHEEITSGWHKLGGIPYWPERPLLRKWLRKIVWMGAILIAPELGVAMAMGQYLGATEFTQRVKEDKGNKETGNKGRWDKLKKYKMKGDELARVHAFYADMGGFILKFQVPSYYKQRWSR